MTETMGTEDALTAERFLTELAKRGLTIKDFAKMTGIPLRTVYGYADGTRRMPRWMPFVLTALKLKE